MPLPCIEVRQSENDAKIASTIDITVAVSAVVIELKIAGTKFGELVSDLMLSEFIRVNMVTIGAITTKTKKSARHICITVLDLLLCFII